MVARWVRVLLKSWVSAHWVAGSKISDGTFGTSTGTCKPKMGVSLYSALVSAPDPKHAPIQLASTNKLMVATQLVSQAIISSRQALQPFSLSSPFLTPCPSPCVPPFHSLYSQPATSIADRPNSKIPDYSLRIPMRMCDPGTDPLHLAPKDTCGEYAPP